MPTLLLFHHGGSRRGQVDRITLAVGQSALIGRDPAAAVRFSPDKDRMVGRRHARILLADDPVAWWLEDLASRNGVFINGERVCDPRPLASGDALLLGRDGPRIEVREER